MRKWLMRQNITRKFDKKRMGRALDFDTGYIEFFDWTDSIKEEVLESDVEIETRDMDDKGRSLYIIGSFRSFWPNKVLVEGKEE